MNYINHPQYEDGYTNRKGVWPNPHEKEDWKKAPPAPKVITIADLFPRLDRLSIGWSPLLEQLKEVTNNKPSYPPYDIVKVDDDINLLNVAVAGFFKQELDVTVEEGILVVKGKKGPKNKDKGEILYQGIATRDFELKLAIAEFWRVNGAALNNGMLTITLQRELPEEKKPKVIDIK